MVNESRTGHSSIAFRVCEGDEDAYVCTREDIDLPLIEKTAIISFSLNDRSFENAQRVVDFLNEYIDKIHISLLQRNSPFQTGVNIDLKAR